jgi:transposase InsO family protein
LHTHIPPETNEEVQRIATLSEEELYQELLVIAEEKRNEIASFKASDLAKGLTMGDTLSDEEIEAVWALLYTYRHTMARKGEVRTVHGYEFSLGTTTGAPFQTPLRRIGKLKETVSRHIRDMLANKIIRRSNSPWSSGICLVPKRMADGTMDYRFCVSYVHLNSMTPKDGYVNPPCEDGLEALGGNQYFSTLDMKSAYWTLPVRNDGSIEKTAFITHEGLFEFIRMPFGLKNAGAAYCRYINNLFHEERWRYLLTFVDDCLVYSKTLKEHIVHLRNVWGKISRAGVTVSAAKCSIAADKVDYLGYRVTRYGLSPNPDKTSAITDMAWPNTKKRMRSFLGIANTFRKFIKGHSSIAKPLNDLLKSSAKIPRTRKEATGEQRTAFDTLKEKVTTAPVLAHPNFNHPFTIETDGSVKGLGAVLTQTIGGKTKPVMYCSRSLKGAEARYTPYERECLALVWATDVLRPYLLGAAFKVITDNYAVSVVFGSKKNQQRLVPWKMKLQQYDFEIVQRPRRNLVVPDALANIATHSQGHYNEQDVPALGVDEHSIPCRHDPTGPMAHTEKVVTGTAIFEAPALTATEVPQKSGLTLKEIAEEQREDERCAEMMKILASTEAGGMRKREALRKAYFLHEGVLKRQPIRHQRQKTVKGRTHRWEVRYNSRIVIPRSLRQYFLRQYHGTGLAGHSGKHRTTGLISEHWYWKGMTRDVAAFIKGCPQCRTKKDKKPTHQGEHGYSLATEPFDTLAMDIITDLPDDDGHRHILTAIDTFTRFAFAIPIKDRSAETVATALAKHIFQRHGGFGTLRTDNEKAFVGKMMETLTKRWNISHLTTVPYHSETNGHVERLHRYINAQLTILAKDRRRWTEHTQPTIFAYNIGVHRSTGFSPYFLMHGRRPKLPIEFIINTQNEQTRNPHQHYANKLQQIMTEAYREARVTQEKAARRTEKQKGKKRKQAVFRANDMVMYFESEKRADAKQLPRKLTKNASGPHRVLRQIDAHRYIIHHTIRMKEVIVSVRDISLWTPFTKYTTPATKLREITPGDLCIVPLRAADEHPFHVARVMRVGKTLTVQWLSNTEDIFMGQYLPEWRDPKGEVYCAVKPDVSDNAHKANTNANTGPIRLPRSHVKIYGFALTSDHRLKPETLATISKESSVGWTLRQPEI